MSNNSSTIPKSLQDALKARQVIPFVGAGVSRAIRKKDDAETPLFPSWWEFLSLAADKLEKEGKTPKANVIKSLLEDVPLNYLDIAQRSFDSLGIPLWNDLLMQTFKRDEKEADEKTLELAQLVWQLGSNLVFTTNIDDVLEWTSVKDGRINILDTQTDEFAELQRNEINAPTLFYLHGRIADKRNIVFTRDQYKEFYDEKNNKAKLETLRSFLTRKVFLFIGFSLDDPYFVEQLKYIHEIYGGSASRFYVLLRKSERGRLSHLDFVTEVPYEDFGEPLLEIMREMHDIARGNDLGKDNLPPNGANQPNPLKPDYNDSFSNIPFPSKGTEFVGREGKLEEIWNSLSQGGRAAIGQAVSIKGIGGLGKTQLAVEYAHYYRNKTNKEVYWLTADQDLDNQLIQIALKKKWLSETDKDFDQAEVARNRFRELSDCLIVFDNVETPESIKNYLPKDRETTYILITSREKQSGFRQIDLDVLSLLDASDLLLKVAEREPENDLDEKGLEEILKQLGGLPLALELVGGYLKEHSNVSFAKYLEFLQEVPLDRLEAEFPEDNFTNHDKSIIRTLRISEKLLLTKPILREILDILAWSGTSSMGISLLRDLIGAKDDFALLTALGDAISLRLIRKEDGIERYTIHRLLAKVRRHENPLVNRKDWHKEIVKRLEYWFGNKVNEFSLLPEFENELEHLHEWQKLTLNFSLPEAVWLTALIGNPLWLRGNFKKALKSPLQALELYNNNLVDDNELLAKLYNTIGFLYNELKNYSGSKTFCEKALEIVSLNKISNKELLANIYNDLGLSYNYLGDFANAETYHRMSLNIRRELYKDRHLQIAKSLMNLGGVYNRINNYQEALKHHEQALQMLQELYGDKHPLVATSLENLAYTYKRSGNKVKAIEYCKASLKIKRNLLGEKHPYTISSCLNLISVLSETGGIEKAMKLAREFLSYIPRNHPDRKFFEKHAKIHSGNRKKRR
jgi:tetratricopeptide (TPR) repeat protein